MNDIGLTGCQVDISRYHLVCLHEKISKGSQSDRQQISINLNTMQQCQFIVVLLMVIHWRLFTKLQVLVNKED